MPFEFVQGVHLKRTDEAADEIDALAERLGGRAGVDGLLADLPRKLRRSLAPGLKVSRAFRWSLRDGWDKRWWPQGVTTSADASDTEDIAGRRILAASWYAKDVAGVGKGSRISFVDLGRRRYRHVLLVVPSFGEDGTLRLDRLNVHAGGIVWCGPYLHIAATKRGLFTARVDDIMRVPDELRDPDRNRIGLHAGQVSTYGYRYVLPVRFAYRSAADDGFEQIRYSFLSLNRSGRTGGSSPGSTAAAAPPPGCSATRSIRSRCTSSRARTGWPGRCSSSRAASATCRAPRRSADAGTSPAPADRGAWAACTSARRAASGATAGRFRWARRTSASGRPPTRSGRSPSTPDGAGSTA